MIQPTPKLCAAEKALMNVLVQIANDNAERLHRLSTIDEIITDEFVANMFENAEVVIAIWREAKPHVGFLPVKGSIYDLGEQWLNDKKTFDPDAITAVWVRDRAMADAMKVAMEIRRGKQ